MRTGLISVATALVLSGTVTAAEARFRGGRSGHAPRPSATATNPTGAGSRGIGLGIGVALPTGSTRVAAATAKGRPVTLRPIKPVLAPVPAQIREVRTATRCFDRRLVGSGAGFCEIN